LQFLRILATSVNIELLTVEITDVQIVYFCGFAKVIQILEPIQYKYKNKSLLELL